MISTIPVNHTWLLIRLFLIYLKPSKAILDVNPMHTLIFLCLSKIIEFVDESRKRINNIYLVLACETIVNDHLLIQIVNFVKFFW